jgi:D-alanyl-D-alanine carboxypeptidase
MRLRLAPLLLVLLAVVPGVVRADAGAPPDGPSTAPSTPPSTGPSTVAAAGAAPGPTPIPSRSLGIGSSVSAVLVEVATGQVLVAGDHDTRRPIASAIKLVTALAVVEALPPGTAVTIGDEVLGIEGSSYELRPGQVRSVEDLLVGLLLRSGNDAAVALAVAVDGSEAAFVDRMERTLAELGVAARPGSASGLDDADALSAQDLATVSLAALREPRIRALVGAPTLTLPDGRVVENRNLFLLDVEGATGLKTGFTSLAGFTLAASAQREGRELLAVVLGAEDDQQRRALAARLIEHGFTSTVPQLVAPSLRLRTAAGDVLLDGSPQLVTVAPGTVVAAGWPVRLRVEDAPATVDLLVDGRSIGAVAVAMRDERTEGGDATLGRAFADGVYAALRPVALAGGGAGGLR